MMDTYHGVVLDRPVGFEIEGLTRDGKGRPVSLVQELAKPIAFGPYGMLCRDAGADQFEFVTNPSSRLIDHHHDFERLFEIANRLNDGDVNLEFVPRRPQGIAIADGQGWQKSRLKALLTALSDPSEGGELASEVLNIGNICASHIHFGFSDVRSEEANLACCLLNAAAPTILKVVHRELGIPLMRRNIEWTRFARPARLPGARWYGDFASFQRDFESIPRLIKKVAVTDSLGKDGDEWEPDLETKQQFGDEVSDGTTWWAVRLRPSHNTIEFRPLPSMRPERLMQVVPWIDAWLSEALERVGTRQFRTLSEAVSSGLVPTFRGEPIPDNDSVWLYEWMRY